MDREGADGGAVVTAGGKEESYIGVYEFGGVVSASAEIKEFEFVGGCIVKEIRPVRIRLHKFEFCNFAKTETQDLRAYPVFLGLGEGLDFGHADAGHAFHG